MKLIQSYSGVKGLDKLNEIIVVGGGPAGMMAAGTAAMKGYKVTLIEKNNMLGKKLLITGKGRCNITNSCDIDELIDNIHTNGNFLYSSFYTFSNTDLIEFFEKLGLKTKVERGNRVFPASDKSHDVVNALTKYIKSNGVLVIRQEAKKILTKGNGVIGIETKDGSSIKGDKVIIATGGMSYPATGSTGDGYRMAKELGHTIIPLKPSLVPLVVKEKWIKELQGLSLKNVSISVFNKSNNKKRIYSDFGEMIFTHFGLSGPIVLSASAHMQDLSSNEYILSIDLKPALTEEQLDKRIQRDFEKYSRKQFKNALDDLFPKKLIPIITRMSGIPDNKPVNQITKDERLGLVSLIKGFTLHIIGTRPIKEAIITSGGVSTDEIDPGTMESKLIKGLYFAGEIIDVDAYTGGFNLQIAFSTGYVAGFNCTKRMEGIDAAQKL